MRVERRNHPTRGGHPRRTPHAAELRDGQRRRGACRKHRRAPTAADDGKNTSEASGASTNNGRRPTQGKQETPTIDLREAVPERHKRPRGAAGVAKP